MLIPIRTGLNGWPSQGRYVGEVIDYSVKDNKISSLLIPRELEQIARDIVFLARDTNQYQRRRVYQDELDYFNNINEEKTQ